MPRVSSRKRMIIGKNGKLNDPEETPKMVRGTHKKDLVTDIEEDKIPTSEPE